MNNSKYSKSLRIPFNQFKKYLLKIGINKIEGYKIDLIKSRAKELKIELPDIFIEFYSKFAATKNVKDTFNYFLSPSKWDIIDDRLVFLEENQNVVFWGIHKLHLQKYGDPIVDIANNTDPIEWVKEDLNFSNFIQFVFFYNIIMGTFNRYNERFISKNELKLLRQKSQYDEFDNGMRILIIEDVLISIFVKELNALFNSKKLYSIDKLLSNI